MSTGTPKARQPSWVRSKWGRLHAFLTQDVWDIELSSLAGSRRLGVKMLRIVHLIIRGYRQDECPLHAAALTFNTLMSIVPVLALSFSLAKGFGAGDVVQTRVRETVLAQLGEFRAQEAPGDAASRVPDEAAASTNAPPPAATNAAPSVAAEDLAATVVGAVVSAEAGGALSDADIVSQIDGLLAQIFGYVENINFAALGGLGLAVLVWSVISVLGRVEASFNRVWGVAQSRSTLRKFTDYLGVLILTPFLILVSSSLPAIELMHRFLPDPAAGFVAELLRTQALKHVAVVTLVSISFGLFIMVMPNTRVRTVPGFCGGVIAAILFLGWMWICVRIQVGAAKAGAIYGSFAIVPIMLLWVLISWHIVLVGAEVAFAVQNYATIQLEQTSRFASTESRIVLALSIVGSAADTMARGAGVWDSHVFAREQRIPIRLLNDVLRDLATNGYLAPVAEREGCYALLKTPDSIQKRDIVEAMIKCGEAPESLGLDKLKESSDRLLMDTWNRVESAS